MFLAVAAILYAVIAFGDNPSPTVPQDKDEPGYADVSLGEWVKQLKQGNSRGRLQAARALRAIGPSAKSAVPDLITALDDPDQHVSFNAGLALGEIGPEAKAAVPLLLKTCRSEEMFRSGGSSIALSHIGAPAVPALIEALSDDNEHYRWEVVYMLERIGPPAKAAAPALKELLKAPSVKIRIAAASALWAVAKDPASLTTLSEALKEKDWTVRSSAVRALGKVGADARPAVAGLIDLLGDEDVIVRHDAVGALGDVGPDAKAAVPGLIASYKRERKAGFRNSVVWTLRQIGPAAVPGLVDALKDMDDEEVRDLAAEALGHLGSEAKEAVRALTGCLKSGGGKLRVTAALALWRIDKSEAGVPVLIDGLGSREEFVSWQSAKELGEIGPAAKDAVPALRQALQGDSVLREYAVIALGRIGHGAKDAVDDLKKTLTDKKSRIRVAAALSVWQITKEEAALEPLVAALKSPGQLEREQAVRALQEVGAEAKPAMQALIRALDDDDDFVATDAALALGEIGPAAKPAVPRLIRAMKEGLMHDDKSAAKALKKIDPEAARKAGVR